MFLSIKMLANVGKTNTVQFMNQGSSKSLLKSG